MHHCNFEKIDDIHKIIKDEVTFTDLFEYFNEILSQKWCDSIKLGSEVEDNSFEELSFVKSSFQKKLRFKIGGSGAKNDIRFALKNKVNVITLPMAESRYAIENFLENIFKNKYKDYEPILAMNIETITIVNNLSSVKDLLNNFQSFTIGRSDLSGSLNVKVNDPIIDDTIISIIKFIKTNFTNSRVSIGGKITPKSASHLVNSITEKFDFINTKFLYIDANYKDQIKEITEETLKAEIALFALFYKKGYRTEDELIEFAVNNFERMKS